MQETANSEVEVEIDDFHAAAGVVQLQEGLFKGRSLVYSGLKHVVVRLHPKYDDSALENAILVSSHVDTVITAEGAGDCSSCVAVMLELLRALSHWAQASATLSSSCSTPVTKLGYLTPPSFIVFHIYILRAVLCR